MSFSQWFWKTGYIVVPLLVALIWFFAAGKSSRDDPVNPAVFKAFNEIEQNCRQQVFDQQSEACRKIDQYKKDCLKISAACDSRTFYDFLSKLGYSLPAYAMPRSTSD